MAIAIGDITSQASATSDFVLGATAAGQARRFPLNTLAASYLGTGTGAVTRTYKAKVEEVERSIIDFGGDPTGAADCTTAFNNAKAAGVTRLHFPAGTYRFNSTILIDESIDIYGDGRELTTLLSYVSGANHGMRIIGDAALGRSNVIKVRDLNLEYVGTGQTVASGNTNTWSGVYVQRGVRFENFYVHGFTNDGIYFAPSNSDVATGDLGTASNAVFFAFMLNTWSKDNGRDGIRVRYGANANIFINCQFDRNGGSGFHHMTDGIATYGNIIIGGQASYNSNYGYYFESGTDINACGLYAEFNWSPTNTDVGYQNGQLVDFFIGDNVSRSTIVLGTVFSADYSHVRAPNRNLNNTCMVTHGGLRIFGSASHHIPTRASTGIANLAAGATLTDVINKVNEIIGALENASVTPTV